jgi:hypothetical protein
MKIEYGSHRVYIYDSLDNMPINRWHEFGRRTLLLPLEANPDSYLDAAKETLRALSFDDKKGVENGIKNMLQIVSMASEKTSISLSTFSCLVKNIDGEDMRKKDIDEIYEKLVSIGIESSVVLENLFSVKKKWSKSGILSFLLSKIPIK